MWSYPAPIPECPKIENLLSFYNEPVDLYVDGVLQVDQLRRSLNVENKVHECLRLLTSQCCARYGPGWRMTGHEQIQPPTRAPAGRLGR